LGSWKCIFVKAMSAAVGSIVRFTPLLLPVVYFFDAFWRRARYWSPEEDLLRKEIKKFQADRYCIIDFWFLVFWVEWLFFFYFKFCGSSV